MDQVQHQQLYRRIHQLGMDLYQLQFEDDPYEMRRWAYQVPAWVEDVPRTALECAIKLHLMVDEAKYLEREIRELESVLQKWREERRTRQQERDW